MTRNLLKWERKKKLSPIIKNKDKINLSQLHFIKTSSCLNYPD